MEKLTAQIIKNVQLKINNIHIRYEDKVTQPGKPFCLGVTLKKLEMATTDETWQPTIVQEAVTKVFKVIKYSCRMKYMYKELFLGVEFRRFSSLLELQFSLIRLST